MIDMSRLAVFDLETDGLLDEVSVIHTLVIWNGTDFLRYRSVSVADRKGCHGTIEQGLKLLQSFPAIMGHNIIRYDVKVIQKLYPWFVAPRMYDTFLIGKVLYPDIEVGDWRRVVNGYPKNLVGRHSLEAWGHRLEQHKGSYGKDMANPWARWSIEMEDYCVQDVLVTRLLGSRLAAKNPTDTLIELEQSFADLIWQMEINGNKLNIPLAESKYQELAKKRLALERTLVDLVPPTIITMLTTSFDFEGQSFESKKDAQVAAREAYRHREVTLKSLFDTITPGAPKTKSTPFNPASRPQVVKFFVEKYRWKPEKLTDKGQPAIDEGVLKGMPYPEAVPLLQYFELNKMIGMLAEGKNGWLACVKKDGRIHGRVDTCGAVTRRCIHNTPNMGQIPKTKEWRELFGEPIQLGVDAAGCQLRCLAHYMSRFDDGAYVKVVTEGDVHTTNQLAAKLATRDNAKTFIYAFLFGAGDEKIGRITMPKGTPEAQLKAAGKALKAQFMRGLPALKRLKDAISSKISIYGYLVSLDGGHLKIRSEHSALCTLLQHAEALLVKKATVLFFSKPEIVELMKAGKCKLISHTHDEFQTWFHPSVGVPRVKELGLIAEECFAEAGRFFNFRCPIGGNAKVGDNWGSCH